MSAWSHQTLSRFIRWRRNLSSWWSQTGAISPKSSFSTALRRLATPRSASPLLPTSSAPTRRPSPASATAPVSFRLVCRTPESRQAPFSRSLEITWPFPAPSQFYKTARRGLPTTLNGASIAVTVGGKTVFPALYFATPTELAAVLPASTPIGAGTITVTYNNVVTAPFPIDVVPSAYGIDVYNGSMAVATDALSGALLTPIASGQPGQVVILWGTGLGSDPGDSDTTYSGSPQPIQTQVDAYVGGVKVPKIAYAGGSVYPGVHVIGFTIPQGVPNGCYVPVIVITGGSTISNGPTLPIADDGGVCSDPALGIDGDMISRFNAQPVTRIGALTVGLQTSPGAGTPNTFSYALASFQSRPGMPFMGAGVLSVGTCTVGSGSVSTPSDSITGLDPGIVTVTDPSGASTALANELDDMGDYQTQWHPSNIPPSGGTFMFGGSGGAGSTEVGPFTATVNFPQLTNWTNQSAFSTVSRSSPQSFTWGAGSPGSYITVGSSSSSGQAHGSYSCSLPADGGQAAVPSYLLLALPAGIGTTTFEAWTVPTTFTAGNLDYGFATTFIGVSVKSTVRVAGPSPQPPLARKSRPHRGHGSDLSIRRSSRSRCPRRESRPCNRHTRPRFRLISPRRIEARALSWPQIDVDIRRSKIRFGLSRSA